MSAGSITSTTTISGSFARWYRFLTTLTALLIIETVLAAVIRTRILVATMTGARPFGLIEALAALGLLMFPVMLYAIVRIRIAQQDLDLLVSDEQESADATRVLLDTTTEGIYAIDPTGRCTMANRAAGEHLGYLPEELLGRNMHELVHHTRADGSPYPVEECAILRVLQDGDEHRVDDDILWRKDGSSFSAAYSASPIARGEGVEGAVVTFTNITARKAAAAELEEQAEMLDLVEDAVIALDMSHRITYWNRTASVIYGWSRDEALDQTAYELLKTTFPIPRAEIMREVNERGRWEGELVHRRKDGTEVVVASRWVLRRDEAGRPTQILEVNNDITEQKRAEEAIALAHREAERANLAKSEFLSRMSHELRTPLNAILGFAQLLEMDELSSEQRESTEQIVKGGRRLLELINEVLDIARIESGRLSLSLEPVLVCDLIDESVALIKPLANERGIRIDSECTETSRLVRADRHRLGQVLLNLLSNAVKYNAAEGTVTVTCTPAQEGRLRIGVTDTGPGIAPDKLPLLFTPFERLGADQSEVEGTGLGLALSKNLVEAMGGTLTVDTMNGQGTTFWIDIAVTDESQLTTTTTDDEDAVHPMTTTAAALVLYIEDNLANLRLVERLLGRRSDVEVISAMSGTLGLDLARQHLPDLILLDLGLPDIKGDEVLIRLRKDPKTADIPVVILSADATPGEIKRLLAAGAVDYLTKPIDVAVFLRIFDRHVRGDDLDGTRPADTTRGAGSSAGSL